VAVDQVSPHNSCPRCAHQIERSGANACSTHVCLACGFPQPIGAEEDYFDALSAPRRFIQDRSWLEKRFYEISRLLHPDRFTAADSDTRKNSLERMSLVNEAYRTLRDPELLRDYVLKQHGIQASASVPAELAEGWFEMQEAVAECEPEVSHAKINEFQVGLKQRIADELGEIGAIERSIGEMNGDLDSPSRETLEDLAARACSLVYLKSLARDAERLKGRIA
jgi:curved DNA-binding protein CbpA